MGALSARQFVFSLLAGTLFHLWAPSPFKTPTICNDFNTFPVFINFHEYALVLALFPASLQMPIGESRTSVSHDPKVLLKRNVKASFFYFYNILCFLANLHLGISIISQEAPPPPVSWPLKAWALFTRHLKGGGTFHATVRFLLIGCDTVSPLGP